MERPDPVEKAAKVENQEAAGLLFEAAAGKPKPLNIEKESQKIANVFDFNTKKEYDNYSDSIVKGSQMLSSDLQRLEAGDRNKLLKSVADKIPDEPAMNPWIRFSKDGKNVASPDKADNIAVMSGDSMPAYSIVQPGNTFNQIAKDTYREFVKAAGSEDALIYKGYDEYRKSLIDLNKIEDPNVIHVGQAIRLRDSFTWS
jgi:hypothetical protein